MAAVFPLADFRRAGFDRAGESDAWKDSIIKGDCVAAFDPSEPVGGCDLRRPAL